MVCGPVTRFDRFILHLEGPRPRRPHMVDPVMAVRSSVMSPRRVPAASGARSRRAFSSSFIVLGGMRPLLLVAVCVFWISIMAIECGYCSKICKTSSGLSLHRRSCRTRDIQQTCIAKAARRRKNVKKPPEPRSISSDDIRSRKRARSAEAEETEWRNRVFGPKVSAYSLSSPQKQKLWRPHTLRSPVYIFSRSDFSNVHVTTRSRCLSPANPFKLLSLHWSPVLHTRQKRDGIHGTQMHSRRIYSPCGHCGDDRMADSGPDHRPSRLVTLDIGVGVARHCMHQELLQRSVK